MPFNSLSADKPPENEAHESVVWPIRNTNAKRRQLLTPDLRPPTSDLLSPITEKLNDKVFPARPWLETQSLFGVWPMGIGKVSVKVEMSRRKSGGVPSVRTVRQYPMVSGELSGVITG